jgi:signal transduction histidine kinase
MIVRRARLRLTGLLIAVFAVVIVAFTVAFFLAFAFALQPDIDIGPELTNAQAAEAASTAVIERVGISLVVADIVAIGAVAVIAWFLARRTLEPVREAHQRQQRFVADASHETRNPLAAIKATTGVALSGERSKEELRVAIQTIDSTVDRLIHLTGDLLVLARTNDPLAPSNRVPSDLSVVVSEALRSRPHVGAGRSQVLESDLEPDLPVRVDPAEIERIVSNLVDNATRYAGPVAGILVRTFRTDADAVLEVRDDGPGIAAADLPRIFDPFYRAAGQARERDGVGLGLSIARDLAQRNGGRLTATSSPGRGSTFSLTLPRLR